MRPNQQQHRETEQEKERMANQHDRKGTREKEHNSKEAVAGSEAKGGVKRETLHYVVRNNIKL